MPFNLQNLAKYNSTLKTSKQKEQWLAIANSTLERCLEQGKPQSECDADAIKTANSVLAMQKQNKPPKLRECIKGRDCKNCQYYNLGLCELYNYPVKDNFTCDMWMPIFKNAAKAIPKKYAHINFKPPQSVIDIAKRALNKIELAGSGMEQQTKIWARKIANGESITPEKARQGYRWFTRNNRFKDAPKDSPAWIAYLFWFGKPGKQWFNRLWQQMEAADEKE